MRPISAQFNAVARRAHKTAQKHLVQEKRGWQENLAPIVNENSGAEPDEGFVGIVR